MARPAEPARLRPASAADASPLTTMLADLSSRSAFQRFFAGLGSPTASLVDRLLRRDGTHGAWVAEVDGRLVAHALWALDDDVAEIGVVVADAWHGAGIGTRLMEVAVTEAAVAGGRSVRVDVHSHNGRLLRRLAARRGSTVTREAQMVTFRWPLRDLVLRGRPCRATLSGASAGGGPVG